MNDADRSPEVRNATILMVLTGVFNIYTGYQFFQFPEILPNSFHTIIGTLMIVFGFLTFCASLAVWLQKTWATKIVAGVGVAVCATFILFGYYLAILLIVLLYGATIDYIRKSRVIITSDWDDN